MIHMIPSVLRYWPLVLHNPVELTTNYLSLSLVDGLWGYCVKISSSNQNLGRITADVNSPEGDMGLTSAKL